MKIKKVSIHNFRSIKEESFSLENFSLLIGENNSGKSNVINAIRTFYENDGAKFSEKDDFPKFPTDDKESWVEITFQTNDDEQATLKSEYRSVDKLLKVRRYFKSSRPELVKSNQSNIYAYENGVLSENLFYGAQNISQAKLGRIIYIPEISKSEDNLKLTGPSPFREMVTFVMKKVVRESPAYREFETSFDTFNTNFQDEYTKDGFSINSLTKDINEHIKNWEVKFGINFNPIKPEDIIKNLLSHYFLDNNLNNEKVNISAFGQGLQRHLIYTLIKLSAKYIEHKAEKKKTFAPDFTLILFEEPEAFLHPSQQEQIDISLKKLSNEEEQQIICTTHSPIFVSKNISELLSLIRICKLSGQSNIFQLDQTDIDKLLDDNLGLFKKVNDLYNDSNTPPPLKAKIKEKFLSDDVEIDVKLEEESMRYFLWMDSERASLFFAKHIIICEGATEKILLDYLVNNEYQEHKMKNVYFLDAMGKFNFHRYMNLFNKFGISHSLLMDKDSNSDIQAIVNEYIQQNKNGFTKSIEVFDPDIEGFLGITKPAKCRNDRKPLNVLINYNNGSVKKAKIKELIHLIEKLF